MMEPIGEQQKLSLSLVLACGCGGVERSSPYRDRWQRFHRFLIEFQIYRILINVINLRGRDCDRLLVPKETFLQDQMCDVARDGVDQEFAHLTDVTIPCLDLCSPMNS